MKKFLQLVMVCAGVGIVSLSTSCSTKDYDAGPTFPGRDTIKNSMRGDFTANINGVAFKAENKYASDITQGGVRSISISGVMDSYDKDPKNNQTISLYIANYTGPNTYVIQNGVAGSYINMEENVPTTYLAKTGDTVALIQITSDAGNLQGKFNFVVAPNGLGTADNISITDGSFDVPK